MGASFLNKALWLARGPRPKVDAHPRLSHCGTPYGGWHFVADENLREASILSAGLGTDASFDVALASIYSSKVVLVDPTPQAVSHFRGIQERLGSPAQQPFSSGGLQPLDAYDTSHLGTESLVLERAALSDESGTVRFFAPPNKDHVSYSITNYQQGRKQSADFLEVDSISFTDLLAKHFDQRAPVLVKLDIEGAELRVLPQILDNPPQQLLVEFDELNLRDSKSIADWREADTALRERGFLLAHFDRFNFSYIHEELY